MATKTFKLSDIFQFLQKSHRKAGDGLEYGRYPFFTSSKQQTKWLNEADYKTEAIVLGTGGAPSVHCATAFSTSADVFVISPKIPSVSAKYVYYFLSGNRRILERGFKGAGLRHLSRDYTQKILIPLPVGKNGNPDLAAQKRIVDILEGVEALKNKRAAADRKMSEIVPALFEEMFGDIISNSKKWPIVKFSEIGEARLGKMLDAKQQTGKNKRLYLRNANVQWGKIELHDLFEMDFSENEREKLRLRYDDLLICEGGEIGRAAIWKDELPECYFQKALHRVRLNPSLATPEFVLYFLKSLGVNGFHGYVSGTATIPHLTGVKLASIRVPLPPLTLQTHFAERVKAIESQREKQKQSAAKLDELFHALLSRAFCGKTL